MCLEKGVESDKGTSVAYFECSSYNFDRDRNSQTKVSAKMAVQFSCGWFSCFVSYLCQYRDGEVERVIFFLWASFGRLCFVLVEK